MKKIMIIGLLFMAWPGKQLYAAPGISGQKLTITFNYKVYTLNATAQNSLDSLLAVIKSGNYSIGHIEIAGHCDSIGSNRYNDELSIKRSENVRGYLVSKGISDSLITSVRGFGKRKPLNDNSDDINRSYNRRVEISFQLNITPQKEAPVETLKTTEVQPLIDSVKPETIDISKAQVNDIIQLSDINFLPDRHIVTDESRKALDVLLNTMRENKTLRIEIRGHVCCLPDYQGDAFDQDTYSEDLSLQRAKEIYLFLADYGIARDRMTYIGLGARYPLVKEFNEFDKAKNRRVEIRILGK